MAITARLYAQGYVRLMTGTDIDWVSDTIKAALLASTYTPDQDNDEFFSDVNAHEIAGAPYVAGGEVITNRAVTYDAATKQVRRTGDDVTWPAGSLTARYVIVYKDTGNPATSRLISYLDYGQSVISNPYVANFDSTTNLQRVALTELRG